MWDPHRTAEEPCHIYYTPVTPMDKFPLPIIKKASQVNDALREWGLPGIEICGDKITARDAGQECTFHPYMWGPGIRCITTRTYGDKAVTIACMCILIALWQEGFIKDCNVKGNAQTNFDIQNTTLWQTAWGIIMDMEAKNENHKN